MSFNVLVVDDSRTVRAVLTKTLKIAKIPTNQVFEAENGKDALDIVADEWIDLIFADINMPIMNGVEMIERLKGDPCSESIPVVVVSTERSRARLDELERLGVQACLSKPFKPGDLKSIVVDILGENNG